MLKDVLSPYWRKQNCTFASVMLRLAFIIFPFLTFFNHLHGQGCIISGEVVNQSGEPVEDVNVFEISKPMVGVFTNKKGKFTLKIKGEEEVNIVFSHLSYYNIQKKYSCYEDHTSLVIVLEGDLETLPDVQVKDHAIQDLDLTAVKIEPKNFTVMPSVSGSFESILSSLPGVSSRNELSSQYSVRGGNFDENLIYVNDIEIYRPFLVRSGQQEGLSFINPDLISGVSFSAGGFEARYGDKMSSVLDVEYKEPSEPESAVQLSFLGASIYYGNASEDYRFKQLHGLRYRTNQYLLGALETQGAYKPNFLDYQTLLSYQINDELEISFLGNVASNNYQFVPETRQTDFGTIQQALRLTVFFEGQEANKFDTYTGALTLKYKPSLSHQIKWINAAFYSNEREFYDVLGQYRLSELEVDLSKEDFGDEKFNLGVGGYRNHARNELQALVYNSSLIGKYFAKDGSTWLWGVKYQMESIKDNFKEWRLIDSAGYSLPHAPDSVGYTNPVIQPNKELQLNESYKSFTELFTNRYQAYIQHNREFALDSFEIESSWGVRVHYWDYNNQPLISPRLQLKTSPLKRLDSTIVKFAMGLYQQPPFYRELRDPTGLVYQGIKAQSSAHFVLGSEHDFKMWNRPFKFISEIYYKYQWNMIPYYVDNVRIRYYPNTTSKGHTEGLDLKLNGEFVEGLESWFSFSLLQSKEDIANDSYLVYYNDNGELIRPFTVDKIAVDSAVITPGMQRRPTDQRFNVGVFFQDFIPKNPNYKVHLNLLYGSRIPYGELEFRTLDTLEVPPYRRVDIGFSALLKRKDKELAPKTLLNL